MKATIYTNDFNRIIAATKDFVSQSHEARKTLRYIRLEFNAADSIVTAIATDGYRMSVEHAIISECDEDFVVYVHSSIKLPSKMYADIEDVNGETIIKCGGFIFGCQQPEGDFLNWQESIPGPPAFKIGFNGNYLLSALQAAKVSSGGSLRNLVILEFRGETGPVTMRTNEDDIKMVLPIRLKKDKPND